MDVKKCQRQPCDGSMRQLLVYNDKENLHLTCQKLKRQNQINCCKVMAIQIFACFHINFLLNMSGAAAHRQLSTADNGGKDTGLEF